MYKKTIKKLLHFVYFALILSSCKKTDQIDLSSLQTYHHVAIPLVSAEIDVEDMLERDTGDVISTGTDGELFLVYANPPTTLNASEIIEIPDQNFNISVNFKPDLTNDELESSHIGILSAHKIDKINT